MKFWRLRYLFRDARVTFYAWRLRRELGEVSREHQSRVSRFGR